VLRFKQLTEHLKTGSGCGRSPTVHFERRQRLAMTSKEVNFDIPLPPIRHLTLSHDGRIRQVCANSRPDQMTPVFAVRSLVPLDDEMCAPSSLLGIT
jgi:hypothetical protein